MPSVFPFESHFVKQTDFSALYQFKIEEKKKTLTIRVKNDELQCSYEELPQENVDVFAKLSESVMENILAEIGRASCRERV